MLATAPVSPAACRVVGMVMLFVLPVFAVFVALVMDGVVRIAAIFAFNVSVMVTALLTVVVFVSIVW